jgi:dihydroflavonol-4-reductase
VIGDVLDPASLDALFEGVKPGSAVLIHSAAVISLLRNNTNCELVNLTGTENIIAACKKHGARLVYFSSVDALIPAEEGETSEPECYYSEKLFASYGRSKAAGAQRVLDAAKEGLDCAMLLPSAVIGPGDYRNGFLTQMVRIYLAIHPRLSITGGYDFVDVRDVAAAAITASQKTGHGESYILSNTFASVTHLFNTLAAHTGRKPVRFTLPLGVLYLLVPFIGAVCYIAGKEPPLTPEAIRLMRAHPAYCHNKATRELGFHPRPFEQTVADTASFILEQKNNSTEELFEGQPVSYK